MSMNLFRLVGDWTRAFAIWVLLHQLIAIKNAQGLSYKTQVLLLLTCACRYLDLFTSFYSVYNTFFKIFYAGSAAYAVYVLSPFSGHPARSSYRSEHDRIQHWQHLVLPCSALAVFFHWFGAPFHRFSWMEILWTFSILLESVSLVPQIHMFRHYASESFAGGAFIFLYGVYRLLYIFNWIYRANTERYYKHHWLVYICGVVHATLCIGGFFAPASALDGSSAADDAPLAPRLAQFFKELVSIEFLYIAGGSLAMTAALTAIAMHPAEIFAALLPLVATYGAYRLYKKYTEAMELESSEGADAAATVATNDATTVEETEISFSKEDDGDGEEDNTDSSAEQGRSWQHVEAQPGGSDPVVDAMAFLQSDDDTLTPPATAAGVLSFLQGGGTSDSMQEPLLLQRHGHDDMEQPKALQN